MTELTQDDFTSETLPLIDHVPGFVPETAEPTREIFPPSPNEALIAHQKLLTAHEALRLFSAEAVYNAQNTNNATNQ